MQLKVDWSSPFGFSFQFTVERVEWDMLGATAQDLFEATGSHMLGQDFLPSFLRKKNFFFLPDWYPTRGSVLFPNGWHVTERQDTRFQNLPVNHYFAVVHYLGRQAFLKVSDWPIVIT